MSQENYVHGEEVNVEHLKSPCNYFQNTYCYIMYMTIKYHHRMHNNTLHKINL